MDEEFVSYEIAVALKELGFKGDVLAWYNVDNQLLNTGSLWQLFKDDNGFVLAPLKQQVFRWFREKYDAHIHPEKLMPGVYIIHYGTWTSVTYNTYEEAESACIDKLIELAKQQ